MADKFAVGAYALPFNGTVFSSAARTTAQTSDDLGNVGARGLHLIVDVTAVTDTPVLTVTIQGKDTSSGKYYDLLVGAAISATGTTVLKIYPGLAASANAAASDSLPDVWRVKVAVADADSATYSIGATLLP